MQNKTVALIGVEVQSGAGQKGCVMGPAALRIAGLAEALITMGHQVVDQGDLPLPPQPRREHPNRAIHDLAEAIDMAAKVNEAGFAAAQAGMFPMFLGGDHSVAMGSVPGVTRHAALSGKRQFVLWLDAHSDFHTLLTTESGNIHGTPVAYFCGQSGFEGYFPAPDPAVLPDDVMMMGIRSVDRAENDGLAQLGVIVHDMRAIDEHGVVAPLREFLDRVRGENGALHVSLDVDFLDPLIAPAVGTTVPGGATFREAHLIMEMLHDSKLVTSLDLVELNPFLDERGRTARLLVDLVGSLFGRKVMDRVTRAA